MEHKDLSQRPIDTRALKRQYQDLFVKATALLHRFDPAGLGSDAPVNEYEPEVSTILPRLVRCRNAGEVQDMVHEEFSRWFSPDIAGHRDDYLDVSVALWHLWQKGHHSRRDA